ncbi:hypothetical protein BRADI_2g31087v3 [Brachypodium distachyon]|uniref:Uncharacterized protein n=1 Tax=Brachypodium distachyon TaxID=15368 RepID=I1HKL7_BRADI|nr:hypothetical protein BRADI_2g31087v3 [Brachypodium distachyon]
MLHWARPMTGLLAFMGVNLLLLNTITHVYGFVCFHPYWDRSPQVPDCKYKRSTFPLDPDSGHALGCRRAHYLFVEMSGNRGR